MPKHTNKQWMVQNFLTAEK